MSPETPEQAAVILRDPSKPQLAIVDWDNDYRRLVKQTILRPKNREATGVELALFAEQVQRTGLDPFLKQIYGIYRYDGRAKDEVMQVQVGIDGFRLVAERTGKYEGQTQPLWCGPDKVWHDVWTEAGPPVAAKLGVYKRGRREPTYAVAHWREYVQTYQGSPTGKWKDMPANMLAKCAESLALRKCFPAELSGLYTPEEMAQAASPALGDGTGSGEAAGIALGPEVEAVIARATDLGHAALSHRGTIEIQVGGQPAAMVETWVANAHAELDDMPVDAEVVPEAQEAAVRPKVPQTDEHAPGPVDASQPSPQPAQAPQSPPVHRDPDAIERMRVQAFELADFADSLEAEGKLAEAARARDNAADLMAEVDAATDPQQEALPL